MGKTQNILLELITNSSPPGRGWRDFLKIKHEKLSNFKRSNFSTLLLFYFVVTANLNTFNSASFSFSEGILLNPFSSIWTGLLSWSSPITM